MIFVDNPKSNKDYIRHDLSVYNCSSCSMRIEKGFHKSHIVPFLLQKQTNKQNIREAHGSKNQHLLPSM